MIRTLVGLALLPVLLNAAAIKGILVDNYVGRPLARTLITIQRVQGGGESNSTSIRTNRVGHFEFSSLMPGVYLLTARREGYLPLKYGQKAWNAAPTPIVLDQNSSLFFELRMRRMSGISGTVWDENDIGFPNVDVFAYRPTRPPRLAARGKSDERGNFRIGGLEPGPYLIRSGPRAVDDDGGLLPTFHRETQRVDDARVVEARVEDDTPDATLRPLFGRLHRLTCRVIMPPGVVSGTVTLFSDMQQWTTSTESCAFDHLPPGRYEILAIAKGPREGNWADWDQLTLGSDRDLVLRVSEASTLQVTLEEEGHRLDLKSVPIFVRRKDLTGDGPPQRVSSDRATLMPGRWEIRVAPNPAYYASSISSPRLLDPRLHRSDAWTELSLPGSGTLQVRIALSSRPGLLRGRVARGVNDGAIAAPVYLEPWDTDTGRRVAELRTTLTDDRGEFHFGGLVPGQYRIVSSFEFEDPDERAMEEARAKVVVIREARETVQDLDLFVRP